MKIKTKLILGYVIVSALILVVMTAALYGLSETKEHYQEVIASSDTAIINLREIQYYFTGQANDERGFLLKPSPEFKPQIQQKSAEVKKRIAIIKPLMHDDKEKELLNKIDEAHTKFTNVNLQVIDLYNAGNIQEAHKQSFEVGRKARKDLTTSFDELVKIQEEDATTNKNEATANFNSSRIIVVSASLLMILFGITHGILQARSIVNPINKITQQIKDGNLNSSSLAITNDEVGALTKEFISLINNLQAMVLDIKSTAEQVASAAQQLTTGVELSAQAANQVTSTITDVANGAEHQMHSLDSTAKTVEQVSSSIQQVVTNNDAVVNTSNRTVAAAREGLKAIESAVTQIDSIEKTVNSSAAVVTKLGERSKEIGQIVDTISGIAGQTNLLALNAAIEAARAGEQGRGFAVVAEEVRKLAEQSQTAAKQIADLISEIQAETDKAVTAMNEGTKEVKIGSDVVHTAGTSFGQIASLIEELSAQGQKIATGVQQIDRGSQQIASSISEISSVSKNTSGQTQTVLAATEEQSASMEEIAASSQNLARIAEHLQDCIQKFKS